uniref:Ig-like domain-containing protein n=1 Tax=Latimeria chalumnae TaxID=7897 RepID=H3AEQ3_LATCH
EEDGKFNARSVLYIPLKEWNSNFKYFCSVIHDNKNTTESATNVCGDYKKNAIEPFIYLLKPSAEDFAKNDKSKITCLVVGSNLTGASISWQVSGKVTTSGVSNGNVISHKNKTDTLNSTINVMIHEWKTRVEFKCQVEHPCCFEVQPKRICLLGNVILPKMSIFPLIYEEVVKDKAVILTCKVRGFFPDELYVKWMMDGSDLIASEYVNDPIVQDYNKTFSMESRLFISNTDPNSNTTYKCVATTPEQNISEATKKDIFASRRPSLPTIQLLQSAINKDTDQVELVCLASGFSPKNISFEWNSLPWKEAVNTTDSLPTMGEDGKFHARSTLYIRQREWNSNIEYYCSVIHDQKNITKSMCVSLEAISLEEEKPSFVLEEDVNSVWNTAFTFIVLFLITFLYSTFVTVVKVGIV